MWRDPDALQIAPETRSAPLSPALQTFAVNPLRVLRIAARTTTTQATFEAEQALTLSRADISLDTPDLLPWLPLPDPVEMQRAAQTIEEPLLRLKNEFLWFDPAGDPHGALLTRILAERRDDLLRDYLAAIPPLPKSDAADAPPPATAEVAAAINAANLHLLVAACRLDGRWPAGAVPAIAPVAAGNAPAPGTAAISLDVHRTVADDRAPQADAIRAHWQAGLETWATLLSSPALTGHIVARIAAIEDDFVQQDDAATVAASIRAHLIDVSAQEIRALLLRNQYGPAEAMITAIAAGWPELRELTPAMRPVRQMMQSDLTALDQLLDQAGTDKIEPLQRYLRRLAVIRERWQATDRTNILGLADLLDSAAERAFLKLRQWDKPDAQTDAMLQQIAAASSALSLRERVASLRTRQNERRDFVCYYCQENEPDYDCSVVLNGKRFEKQTRKAFQTTNHYTVTSRLVWRCARCSKLHQYVRRVAMAIMLVVGLATAAGIFVWLNAPSQSDYGGSIPDTSTPTSPADEVAPSAPSPNGVPDTSTPPPPTEDAPPSAPSPNGLSLPDVVRTVTAGIADFPTSPPADGSDVLEDEQLRYCLVAKISLDAMTKQMNTNGSDDEANTRNVDFFNRLADQYNAACLHRKYLVSSKASIDSEIELQRGAIEEKAKALIQ